MTRLPADSCLLLLLRSEPEVVLWSLILALSNRVNLSLPLITEPLGSHNGLLITTDTHRNHRRRHRRSIPRNRPPKAPPNLLHHLRVPQLLQRDRGRTRLHHQRPPRHVTHFSSAVREIQVCCAVQRDGREERLCF